MRDSFDRWHRLARRAGVAILFLAAIGAIPFVAYTQSDQLRLVSTAWPPFTNQAGQPRFALDLVEAALGRVGIKTATTIVEAGQFTPALMSGDFDGSAAAWKDPEREKVLLFSQPYLENRLVLVGRKGEDVSASSLAALKGKKVAIVAGYSYGSAVTEGGPTFVPSTSEEDSLKQLLSGAVDYTLMDDLVVEYIVSNHASEAKSKLQFGSSPLVTRQLYLAVRRSRPDAQSIITRFNAQLRGMIADGTYHRLLHVDWIRADIDGDGVAEFVPKSDTAGRLAPDHAYTLLSDGPPKPETSTSATKPRFYVGGNIYTDWATVPNRYKVEDPKQPDSSRSTASIFRFVW
jgi:polar amino acid transport system substrate-binding protein